MILIIMAAREADALGATRRERGMDRQQHRRRLEHELRVRVVFLMAQLAAQGHSRAEAAAFLGLKRSTLSEWERRMRSPEPGKKARGRPAGRAGDLQRLQVKDAIRVYGPTVGVETLKEIFPEVSRGELAHLLLKYRLEFRYGNRLIMLGLRWSGPGRVWAMDLAEPPEPIDGIFRYILIVRDLASGCVLLWLPIASREGKTVLRALKYVFHLYGAPLVLKSDNGWELDTADIRELLKTWGVIHLKSPRYYPRYNGSCEAGIGTLKTYAYHEAARHDRPEAWTCDDVETARLRANMYCRPMGKRGPSAEKCWLERAPITQEERNDFLWRVEQERQERHLEDLEGDDYATLERKAMAAALVACGYLLIRRRVISPLYKTRLWSRIR